MVTSADVGHLASGERARLADQSAHRAWVALLLTPVAFLVATLLGNGLLSLQGYSTGAEDSIPREAIVLAGLPALAVLVAPAVAAHVYGRRAMRLGHRQGRLAARLGAAVAVGLVVLNVLALAFGG